MRAWVGPVLLFASALAAAVLVPAGDAGVTSQEWPYEATGIRSLQRDGLTGAGVTVAYFDTGLDETHAAFADLSIAGRHAFLNEELATDDEDGHGTMVAGILAGRGSSLADRAAGIHFRGAAPGIDLIVFRTIGSSDAETRASILREHVEQAVAAGADILCMALTFGAIDYAAPPSDGSDGDEPLRRDSLGTAIEDALARGVLVVAAAGTAHENLADVEYPANIPGVIAVGAVDEHGIPARFTPTANASRNAPLSEPGNATARWPPDLKPEVVAPGTRILAPMPSGAWAHLTGTSAAAPLVCGGLALLLEAHPEIRERPGAGTVGDVKSALAAAARPVRAQEAPHDPVTGYGIFRADRLVEAYASRGG